MSLLTICQAAARMIKIEVPDTIIGNNGEEAQLLLQCAQFEGEALARRPQGGWVQSIKEEVFNIVSYGPLSGTVANTGTGGRAQITGLADTSIFAENTFGVSGTGILLNSTIRSIDSPTSVTLTFAATATGAVTDLIFSQYAYPVRSDFERPIDNTMWDRTRYWPMSGPLSPQQRQFYKSSIYAQATIQRRFWFQTIQTVTYFIINPLPTDNGSQMAYQYVSSDWCQSSIGVTQDKWKADDDTGILSEYLMQLGVTWRALDRLGMDYSSALDSYTREVNKAVAQDGGSMTLSLTPRYAPFFVGPWSIQDGFFPGPGG